jgi:hypothetical protein
MKRPLSVILAIALHIFVLRATGASAAPITIADYEEQWNAVMISLVKFVQAAAPADFGPLAGDLMLKMDVERASFDVGMVKLLVSDPPKTLARRHLTLMPICQELSTVMLLLTNSARSNDYAATEAARGWMTDQLLDLGFAMQKLESSR